MSINLNYELTAYKGVDLSPDCIIYILYALIDSQNIMTGYTVSVGLNEKTFYKSKIVVNEHYIPDIKLKEVLC